MKNMSKLNPWLLSCESTNCSDCVIKKLCKETSNTYQKINHTTDLSIKDTYKMYIDFYKELKENIKEINKNGL